ncbi:LacI family sucrose operon transcriptional repressor [Gracilibacillus halotolerans]|uniref:LacI family sucrose operon transcriptional repressor n=1 Tax=Gracilibacillus halotolerans TaxID=74386 RepID=A0A841RHL1_9BACI|nr:LacI family DNA-binding transcriptional regulator [Gracilibacillus halotolerans]MBB6512141.1 LacI family sucrose operon transcriptional repressor [Gracilibacillus halotolerans]
MITINDIAKLAGVSRSTVSRYLNDNGYVGKEASERIKKVIDETGYIPSQSAQSLRTKKTGVIGIIVPKISTETASRLVGGMNEVLIDEGYQMLLADTTLDKEKEIEYLRLLQSRNVDGIILLGTNKSSRLIKGIEEAKVPVVVLGQDVPDVTCVVHQDYEATKEMLEYIIERGNRNIGFIGVDESDPAVGYQRKKAYLDVMKQHHLTIKEDWLQQGDFSIESGYAAMQQMWENDPSKELEAIFAVTDQMAVGAIQFLKEKKVQIPRDIAVGTTGASTLSKYMEPSLTTIDFLNEEAGKLAANLLLSKIEGKKVEEKNYHRYRLLKRNSV